MKKNYYVTKVLVLCFLCWNSQSVFAQSRSIEKINSINIKPSHELITNNKSGGCDTLGWDYQNVSVFGPIFSNSEGLVMGNNDFNDYAWATKIPIPNAVGKELIACFYLFSHSSGTGAVDLNVWEETAGEPGNVLTSLTIATGDYSANIGAIIGVAPTSPIPLNGDIFVGYSHPSPPANGDSLAMAVYNGSSNSLKVKFSDGNWYSLSGPASTYEGAAFVAVCDIQTGKEELIGLENQIIVFPNPSTGNVMVTLPSYKNSEVSIYNVLGKEVYNNIVNTNFVNVNLSTQPKGLYFVKIIANGNTSIKRLILN